MFSFLYFFSFTPSLAKWFLHFWRSPISLCQKLQTRPTQPTQPTQKQKYEFFSQIPLDYPVVVVGDGGEEGEEGREGGEKVVGLKKGEEMKGVMAVTDLVVDAVKVLYLFYIYIYIYIVNNFFFFPSRRSSSSHSLFSPS